MSQPEIISSHKDGLPNCDELEVVVPEADRSIGPKTNVHTVLEKKITHMVKAMIVLCHHDTAMHVCFGDFEEELDDNDLFDKYDDNGSRQGYGSVRLRAKEDNVDVNVVVVANLKSMVEANE